MRIGRVLLALAALPFAAGGCQAAGSAGSGAGVVATPAPSGTPWNYFAAGQPTPSATQPAGGSRLPALPPVSFLPVNPKCGQVFSRIDVVLIPLSVTPGKGSLSVTWPRQYGSNYRIAAVRQPLVSGSQPPYRWQNVAASSSCTISATITGLSPGVPYVVWLDAPASGHQLDGTRHLYSGRSGVVYPR